MEKQAPRVDDRPLEIALEQDSEMLLRVNHTAGVRERFGGARVCEAAGDLVGSGEAEPDRELTQKVAPPPRES